MKIEQEAPPVLPFRPITIVIETELEYIMLKQLMGATTYRVAGELDCVAEMQIGANEVFDYASTMFNQLDQLGKLK